jgi:hypothetical protein
VLAFERSRQDRDGKITSIGWQTHGLGERCTQFAARGILASALVKWENPE